MGSTSRNFRLRLVGFGSGSGTPDRLYSGAGMSPLKSMARAAMAAGMSA